jgi:hypothetical protein
MSATITDLFKRELLDNLYSEFNGWDYDSTDSSSTINKYYIGIGKSETWPDEANPVDPNPSKEDAHDFQASLQAMKLVTDLSFVVERRNWSAGSIYTAWTEKNHSDTSVGTLGDIIGSYYVITEENNVYICLQQGMTDAGTVRNSLYKPTEVSLEPFIAGADGYVWKFLYNVGTYNSRRYLTSQWMPVEHIYDSSVGGPALDTLSASRLAQYGIQLNSIPKQILAIDIDSGGVGYDPLSPPSIKIRGEHTGDSARGVARVDENGKIFQVVMKDSDAGPFNFGSGYTERTWVEVVGGGGHGAVLNPVIHDFDGGLGFDPRNDLNASSLMYSVRLIGDEYEVFNIENDFRQVGLIKNPLKDSAVSDELFVGDSSFTAIRGNALKKLYVGSGVVTENIGTQTLVTGTQSGASAYVDYYKVEVDSDCCGDSSTEHPVLFVHQTKGTGFIPFEKEEVIEISNGGGTTTLGTHPNQENAPAMYYSDVGNFSGEVFYIDNRLHIDRDEDQTEDIKIVIDL